MTTMRERIARVMMQSLDDNDCVIEPYCADLTNVPVHGDLDLLILADAVLAELREPTEAMTKAGYERSGPVWDNSTTPPTLRTRFGVTANDTWTAMLDAAAAE
jgi:hypothetical protein